MGDRGDTGRRGSAGFGGGAEISVWMIATSESKACRGARAADCGIGLPGCAEERALQLAAADHLQV